jgi:L-histidine Nalpha-methyltransferase
MQAPAFASEFARQVHDGLARGGQKTLPCTYFYDTIGSLLFQAICETPEYGLTRADDRIIRAHAREIARRGATIVELGSGSGAKTRWLLEAAGGRPRYVPIDVSGSALAACARDLAGLADVSPMEASYLDGLCRATASRSREERFLVLFLGSTIGNFPRDRAAEFLLEVRNRLQPGDALLLGTDLVKPVPRMLAAYDDPSLLTAAFNLNLLARINRELGGNFDLRCFAHEARYDAEERRIEMHLRATAAQQVVVREAVVDVAIDRGETIWTESSHKFRPEDVRSLAREGGWRIEAQWTDREWPFAESLLVPY